MLEDLKNRLRITWNDEDGDLKELIEESESYLSNLTNATFDFEQEKWVRTLLLERCRYDYHNSVDEFEQNFAKELKRLILLVSLGKLGVSHEQADPENFQ